MTEVDEETIETVTDFILGGSKITADSELRHLLLGRKAVTNLDSILKSRTSSQSYGFSSSHIWM